MTAERAEQSPWTAVRHDAWVSDLKQELVERGYDSRDLDALIAAALDRYRSARVRDFIPLLVSRSVKRTLREESHQPRTDEATS